MKPDFFDLDAVEEKLKELPHLHQVAFAASICERILPNYYIFSQMRNFNNTKILKRSIDEIWQILQGKEKDVLVLQQFQEELDEVCPDTEDDEWVDTSYVFEAQEAIFAIYSTLAACKNQDLQSILWVIKAARFNTLELFISDKYDHCNTSISRDLKLEFIANHPLAVQELAKETEDLQRLKELKILTGDFLEWLRN